MPNAAGGLSLEDLQKIGFHYFGAERQWWYLTEVVHSLQQQAKAIPPIDPNKPSFKQLVNEGGYGINNFQINHDTSEVRYEVKYPLFPDATRKPVNEAARKLLPDNIPVKTVVEAEKEKLKGGFKELRQAKENIKNKRIQTLELEDLEEEEEEIPKRKKSKPHCDDDKPSKRRRPEPEIEEDEEIEMSDEDEDEYIEDEESESVFAPRSMKKPSSKSTAVTTTTNSGRQKQRSQKAIENLKNNRKKVTERDSEQIWDKVKSPTATMNKSKSKAAKTTGAKKKANRRRRRGLYD